MYNSVIKPVNIVYRKPQEAASSKRREDAQNEGVDSFEQTNSRAKGATEEKKAPQRQNVDYTKNHVNIAQVLSDFESTVIAINAPKEISEEINTYLTLVEKEASKDEPSRQIILSNLKNASKIADKYIGDTLEKPAKVVEEWIDALFMQNVVLKSDKTQINEKFKINFSEEKTAQIEAKKLEQKALKEKEIEQKPVEQNPTPQPQVQAQTTQVQAQTQTQPRQQENSIEQNLDILYPNTKAPVKNDYTNVAPEVKTAFITAKQLAKQAKPQDALEAYNQALQLAQQKEATPVVAAIHFERGKIYDTEDKPKQALDEYNEATKITSDNNLKTQAYLNMAKIYDDYVKYEPAVANYHKAIAFSGEANNAKGQTVAVKSLTGLFADKFDAQNTEIFGDLAVESAKECNSPKTLGNTYSDVAQNLEYVGKNKKALDYYEKAIQSYGADEQSALEIAQNYLDASKLMRKLGNIKKADTLLAKYYQHLELAGQY